jgi:predicted Zn-dependent protease with MMP-like domain
MPHEVTEAEFERLVEAAIERLPDDYRRVIREDIPIAVTDRPTDAQLDELGIPRDELLLGLFEGIALPDRQMAEMPTVPDRIWLFRQDIEDFAADAEDLVEQVRVTLLHELGHYFGLDEDDLEALGYA